MLATITFGDVALGVLILLLFAGSGFGAWLAWKIWKKIDHPYNK